MEKFKFAPEGGFRDKTAFPDPATEEITRDQFQQIPDQIKNYLNNVVYPVVSNIINPNLLINSDFRNPINQRNFSTQTSKGWGENNIIYTIDRWYMLAGQNVMTATKKEKSIELTASGGTGYFRQPFENELTGTYTFTVNVLSVSGTVALWTNNNLVGNLKVGRNVFTVTETLTLTSIQVNDGASIELEYIKLEKGEIATPLVARQPGEEKALCERYHERINMDVCGTANYRYAGTARSFADSGTWQFKTEKRDIPTITYEGEPKYDGCSEVQFAGISIDGCRIAVYATGGVNYRITGAVELIADSEIYRSGY